MRILFVGDVVGAPGRRILRAAPAGAASAKLGADLAIVNGENAAGGAGLTDRDRRGDLRAPAPTSSRRATTSGTSARSAVLLEREPRVLRPANYPEGSPGGGVVVVPPRARRVAVVNLMGRVFMPLLDDPFRAADRILRELAGARRWSIVDFHAEATSEKIAFAWYLDGRVAAVLGTHTHVRDRRRARPSGRDGVHHATSG